MVRQDKSKSGRVTPKGTQPQRQVTGPTSTSDTGRTPVELDKPSPIIVPILMFGSFILGTGMILFNYLLLDTPSNWYLLGGLGLILVGIVAATQYR